jgi:AhpD family alkylhydroperoxidase
LFVAHPLRTTRVLLGRDLPADFRERVMLAVTRVNACTMCAWFHTREALRAGMDREEVRQLLEAEWGRVPGEQHAALLYAQHWAETQGRTDPAAQAVFDAAYPPRTREAVLTSIRFINAMNRLMRGLEGCVPARWRPRFPTR